MRVFAFLNKIRLEMIFFDKFSKSESEKKTKMPTKSVFFIKLVKKKFENLKKRYNSKNKKEKN